MTIPASFLSAVLPQSLPVVQRTAKTLVQQTTQAFGEWFQPSPGEANGPSEPTSEATKEAEFPPDDRRETHSSRLQEALARWIRSFAKGMGMSDAPPNVTVVSNGVGIPTIEGPESLASPLRESLLSQPDLIEAINQATRDEMATDPLKWMPGHEPEVRWSVFNK